MPAFGKRLKEESINDKMVRLFKEGMSVQEISNLLDVKQDVITNVIRRRCGEDSIPETVVRSKNAVPQANEDAPMKADSPAPEAAPQSEPENTAADDDTSDEGAEGLSKLERFMFEKEKKRQEEADKPEEAAAEETPQDETTGQMEGISLDGLDLDSLGSSTDSAVLTASPEEEAPAEVSDIASGVDAVAEEMAGLSVPEITEDTEIEDIAISSFEGEPETVSLEAEAEAVVEEAAETAEEAQEQPAETENAASAPVIEIPAGTSGSAFDKMKAFAQMQIAANNEKLAELEAQLGSVEGDYTSQLEEAEKAVEEAKVAYEDVITKSEALNEKRNELQSEHRAALARAEEDYRKKLDEIEQNYNDAVAHANQSFAEKEAELNVETDGVDSEKETAKNNFLDKQSVVVDLKEKIETEVESVKKQIATLQEENRGYEAFMN